ncbi:36111_t:CDS:2 [Racocetra persica]|uniref:36111_t:CDS:1 n=1 Tax=Racocetra persica TaxID=160502 RepID=A0ACA9KT11_9GLOM|nr:36111_t:CDS:2 [Racocetra persica]
MGIKHRSKRLIDRESSEVDNPSFKINQTTGTKHDSLSLKLSQNQSMATEHGFKQPTNRERFENYSPSLELNQNQSMATEHRFK